MIPRLASLKTLFLAAVLILGIGMLAGCSIGNSGDDDDTGSAASTPAATIQAPQGQETSNVAASPTRTADSQPTDVSKTASDSSTSDAMKVLDTNNDGKVDRVELFSLADLVEQVN
ncbi:MAG TPA: hypothetical protein VFV93_02115, partial [Thermomicrobiales bacterium]|nr:hypothetical protein [Thermomicrobiales bacterium]